MRLEDLAPRPGAFGPGFEDVRCRIPDLTRLRGTINLVQRLTMEVILRQVIEAERMKGKNGSTEKAGIS